MTDWLNSGFGEDSGGGSEDFAGGSGSYLDLDSPPPPDAAPAPPSAPMHSDGGDYAAQGSYAGDYGTPDPYAATSGGFSTESGTLTVEVQDLAAGYLSDDGGSLHTQQYAPAAPAPIAAPQMAPMNPAMHDLSVTAPLLPEVQHSPASLGGSRGDISDLVLDVEVQVEVCFGDAALTVEEFLEMGRGSVVELDHAVDTPIELKVKGRLVARGQLVTINGNYGMRITEMLGEGRA